MLCKDWNNDFPSICFCAFFCFFPFFLSHNFSFWCMWIILRYHSQFAWCYGMQPQLFQKMRSDLASMWSSSNKAEYPRRIIAWNEKNSTPGYGNSMTIDKDVSTMKVTIELLANTLSSCCWFWFSKKRGKYRREDWKFY